MKSASIQCKVKVGMSKLLAFGCSLTFGDGLPDVSNNDIKFQTRPSKFAWPNHLAKMLNVECLNFGRSAASNRLIWYTAINTSPQPNDIVVILWAGIGRDTVLKKNQKHSQIGHWMDNDISNAYFDYLYDEYDNKIDMYLYMDHLDHYFKNQNVYHVIQGKEFTEDFSWNSSRILDFYVDQIRIKFDYGWDNMHPNQEAHQAIAEKMFQEINKTHE